MKISAEVKANTRARLLNAAVDVISEKGFKTASMREIARRADVGDATIYNYFPSKEKLLYGYCLYVQEQVRDSLQSIENFHEYTLAEQLHQLVETELRFWLPAREFLQEVFALTYASPGNGHEHLRATRELFSAMVVDMLDAAIEAGEIPEQPYHDLLPRLFWDYTSAILAYWLEDDSDSFSNTTHLVDQSIDIAEKLLLTGLIGKVLDMLSFLFRTHLLGQMTKLKNFTDDPAFVSAKRRFMEG